jgi:hypothetical protein
MGENEKRLILCACECDGITMGKPKHNGSETAEGYHHLNLSPSSTIKIKLFIERGNLPECSYSNAE